MLFLEHPELVVRIIVPPKDACLFDVAAQAASDQMHVVHNGSQVVVCSIVPVGWNKLVVKEKPKKDGAIVHSSAYEPVSEGISALPSELSHRKMIAP